MDNSRLKRWQAPVKSVGGFSTHTGQDLCLSEMLDLQGGRTFRENGARSAGGGCSRATQKARTRVGAGCVSRISD